MEKYKERIRNLPRHDLDSLHGVYLSSFSLYSTVDSIDNCSESMRWLPVVQLMAVLRSLGIAVKGATSERKSGGRYICDVLLDNERREDARIVYVGAFNYFTNSMPHPIFSIQKCDEIYLPFDDV